MNLNKVNKSDLKKNKGIDKCMIMFISYILKGGLCLDLIV